MSYIGQKDIALEIARGGLTGYSHVAKFGRNDSVPNGSWEFLNQLGFTAWPLSAATTVRIKAGGNAADDSAGAGAREVTVEGINASGAVATEAITTAGASASSVTTETFIRPFGAYVSSCGTYGGANTGNIIIENGAGGTDLLQITADEGQTQFGAYTIPTGKTGYLRMVYISVDGTKPADIRVMTRGDIFDTTAPASAKRIKLFFDGVSGFMPFLPDSPFIELSADTDVWVEARGSGAITEVSTSFHITLVDN